MFGVSIVIGGFLAANALENLALGKPTYQTDTLAMETSDHAVDGNIDTEPAHGDVSCAHTLAKANAWWEVDLGRIYRIDHVIVFGRSDGFENRFRDVQVFIGYGRSEDDYVLKAFYDGIMPVPHHFQLTSPVYGRWVRITRPSTVNGNDDYLTVCEVQVMGDRLEKAKFEFGDGQIGTGVVLKSSEARTKADCCCQCKWAGVCSAVNYNTVTQMCEELETVTTIEDSNSDSYFYRLP